MIYNNNNKNYIKNKNNISSNKISKINSNYNTYLTLARLLIIRGFIYV